MKQLKMNDWKEPDFGTRQTGMTVPEGFFEDFQQRLEAKIDQLEAPQLKPQTEQKSLPWWGISAAASVALIVGLMLWFYPTQQPTVSSGLAVNPTETVSTETTDLSESMMLASVSDYDIYEALYAEE